MTLDQLVKKFVDEMGEPSTWGAIFDDWGDKAGRKVSEMLKAEPLMRIILDGLFKYKFNVWLRWLATKKKQTLAIDGNKLQSNPGEIVEKIQKFLKFDKLIAKRDFDLAPDKTVSIKTPWMQEKLDIFFPIEVSEIYKTITEENKYAVKKLREIYSFANADIQSILTGVNRV